VNNEKKTELITFHLDVEKKVLLDAVAAQQDRDRSFILSAALDFYLEHWLQETDYIQKALTRAQVEGDAGLAPPEEVRAAFDAWCR